MFFIIVASFLSVFNIKGDGGTDGGPDSYPFTGSGVRYSRFVMSRLRRTDCRLSILSVPCPFPFSIVPRDRKAEELIAANAEAQ